MSSCPNVGTDPELRFELGQDCAQRFDGELHAKTEAAVAEGDAAKRKAMYEEIQKTHRETSPFIVMFQIAYQTGLRTNVKGFYTGGATDSAAYWLISK